MANRRQELYDRIRGSSKDEVIREEMIRLGFWPRSGEVPGDPADEIQRRSEIERQLRALYTEQSRLTNLEVLKKELLKRRLEESRRKQKETKERRERERTARAEAWKIEKSRDIVFLGAGVSGGLNEREPREERLVSSGLPVLRAAEDVARALGVTINELRFLAYARSTSTVSHYRRFLLPKKTGGTRLISAPMPRLKRAQTWILENVLEKVPAHEAAHGFLPDRSIVTNARPHVGAAVVLNLDLEDFFPTVSQRRIKGLFRALGYGEAVATIFSLLTSEPEVDEVVLDGRTYFVQSGARKLPQGAPTSPAITNVLARRLDRRLAAGAAKIGFTYTRYADDLTFSARSQDEASGKGPDVGSMLRLARFVIEQEGFVVHPRKTRVLRSGSRQEVTGVTVNEQLGIERQTLRRFRAFLFQLDKDGPEGKRWGPSSDVFASALGFAQYVTMVDPERGRPLVVRVREIADRHGWKPRPRPTPGARGNPDAPGPSGPEPPRDPSPSPPASPQGGEPAKVEPTKKWWKLF